MLLERASSTEILRAAGRTLRIFHTTNGARGETASSQSSGRSGRLKTSRRFVRARAGVKRTRERDENAFDALKPGRSAAAARARGLRARRESTSTRS